MIAFADDETKKQINEKLLPLVRAGDTAARKQIIENNLPMVTAIVDRLCQGSANRRQRDDLMGTGQLNLCELVRGIVEGKQVTNVGAFLWGELDRDLAHEAEKLGGGSRSARRHAKKTGKEYQPIRTRELTADTPKIDRRRRHVGSGNLTPHCGLFDEGGNADLIEEKEELLACCETDEQRQLVEGLESHEIGDLVTELGRSLPTLYRWAAEIEYRYKQRNGDALGLVTVAPALIEAARQADDIPAICT